MIVTIELFNRFETFAIETDLSLKFKTERERLNYIYSVLKPLVWESLCGMEKQTYGKSINNLPNFPIIFMNETKEQQVKNVPKIFRENHIRQYIDSLNMDYENLSIKNLEDPLVKELKEYDLDSLVPIFVNNYDSFPPDSIVSLLKLLNVNGDYEALYANIKNLSYLMTTPYWDEVLNLLEAMIDQRPSISKNFLIFNERYNEACTEKALNIYKKYSSY